MAAAPTFLSGLCELVCSGVTWRLSGAGLQGAGLLGHRFGQWVTASDQLSALVTLDVPHPHTHATRLSALRTRRNIKVFVVFVNHAPH